jgi:hypothetical protein
MILYTANWNNVEAILIQRILYFFYQTEDPNYKYYSRSFAFAAVALINNQVFLFL